jgi:hypothetical protein
VKVTFYSELAREVWDKVISKQYGAKTIPDVQGFSSVLGRGGTCGQPIVTVVYFRGTDSAKIEFVFLCLSGNGHVAAQRIFPNTPIGAVKWHILNAEAA